MRLAGGIAWILLLGLVMAFRPPPAPPQGDPAKVDAAIKSGLDVLRNRLIKQTSAAPRERELILLTFVHAGVRKGDPVYDQLLRDVLEDPLLSTYRVSLQAMALEVIDRVAHQKRIFQCAQFLVDNQCRNGQWSYGEPTTYPDPDPLPASPGEATPGKMPLPTSMPAMSARLSVKKQRDGPEHGDNSNAQYAALGLRACHDAGILLPKEVIQKAAQWWRESIHGSPPAKGEASTIDPRGWNYGPKGNMPYGSMTAGAVGALAILDALQGVFWRKDDYVNAGMNWLRDNFSVSENPGRHGQHLYYYLYALERAATLYGTDKVGKADWYAEGSRFLLGHQAPDGSWEKNAVDTCFAILFLRKATRPLLDPLDLDRKK
jgi:hypothetical protein